MGYIKYSNDDDVESTVIISGILLVLMIVVWFITSIISSGKYNHGICTYCGGKYVYQQSVGHSYNTNYIYICDKCGHKIEINQFYQDAVVNEK